MFYSLVIIIKHFNSINSRKPWLSILILHTSFSALPFLDSWPQLFFTQGVFWLEFELFQSSKDQDDIIYSYIAVTNNKELKIKNFKKEYSVCISAIKTRK